MNKLKKYAIIGTSIIASAAVIAPFAYKYSLPNKGFKPAVYNYIEYISENSKSTIEKNFSYRTYEDSPEFKQLLLDGKTVGGISSDYQIAELAAKNLIKPIDFNSFFGTKNITYDRNWAQNNYSDFVFQQMANYDKYLYDNFILQGKSEEEASDLGQLWKWTIPYFTQDKVISFNIERLSNLSEEEKQIWLNETPEELNKRFEGKSYTAALEFLKEKGANKFAINDIFRQNNAIGSTYNKVNPLLNNPNPSGDLTLENYKTVTDNFVSTVEKGTGFKINDTAHIELNSSDAEILSNLINPNRNDAVGIIYNGDAIQTLFTSFVFPDFYGNANLKEKNPVRTIRVSNQISIFDGLVVANNISSKEEETKLLSTFYKAAYEGSYGLNEYQNGIFESDLNKGNLNNSKNVVSAINYLTEKDTQLGKSQFENFQKTSAFSNYDFVSYTPPTRYEINLATNFYYNYLVNKIYSNFEEFQENGGKKKELIETWANYIINIYKIPNTSILKPIIITPATNIVNSLALSYYREKTTS